MPKRKTGTKPKAIKKVVITPKATEPLLTLKEALEGVAARGVRGQSVITWNTSTSRPRDVQKATKHIPSITSIKDSIETMKPR